MELAVADMAMGTMFVTTKVEFIPDMIDRQSILALADVGLELLRDASVAEVDSILTSSSIIVRGRENTLEAGHDVSLFGRERKDDFIILLEGGNYEVENRKGWDTSIQAFVRFCNSLEDASRSRVHLLIHSMESYITAMDRFNDMDPPATVIPNGLNLRLALHEWGIPNNAYTIDIARHAPAVVAAYKKRADVCLHPSKVEGFGMNVMECQAGEHLNCKLKKYPFHCTADTGTNNVHLVLALGFEWEHPSLRQITQRRETTRKSVALFRTNK